MLDLLEKTRMSGCRPSDTPMDSNEKLNGASKGAPVDKGRYKRLVGKLIYLSHARPDVAFSMGVVSQFIRSPLRGSHGGSLQDSKIFEEFPRKRPFIQKRQSKKH